MGWSSFCHSSCLQFVLSPAEGAIGSSSPEPPDLSSIPAEYLDLGEVFSKDRALSLPPHRPHDCAIILLPGATLPSSRLYNLSCPERESMEKYLKDSLAAGIIRPSSSPLGAGFLFVAKKDQTLRPLSSTEALPQTTAEEARQIQVILFFFFFLHCCICIVHLSYIGALTVYCHMYQVTIKRQLILKLH